MVERSSKKELPSTAPRGIETTRMIDVSNEWIEQIACALLEGNSSSSRWSAYVRGSVEKERLDSGITYVEGPRATQRMIIVVAQGLSPA